MSARILIVEDEEALAEGVRFNLMHDGFDARVVGSAEDGEAALAGEEAGGFGLVLLDVMLPGQDGFWLLERIRARGLTLPVILLTARGEDHDIIRGLEQGADDYVTKPFSLGQLVARIRAVLRRYRPAGADEEAPGSSGVGSGAQRLVSGATTIDLERGTIEQAGRTIGLTATEVEILRVIAAAPGHVASRNDILNEIWGHGSYPSTRTVDNHIARIRKKLEQDPAQPGILITVHNRGYRLVLS